MSIVFIIIPRQLLSVLIGYKIYHVVSRTTISDLIVPDRTELKHEKLSSDMKGTELECANTGSNLGHYKIASVSFNAIAADYVYIMIKPIGFHLYHI